jgi:hypothetical protein
LTSAEAAGGPAAADAKDSSKKHKEHKHKKEKHKKRDKVGTSMGSQSSSRGGRGVDSGQCPAVLDGGGRLCT